MLDGASHLHREGQMDAIGPEAMVKGGHHISQAVVHQTKGAHGGQ